MSKKTQIWTVISVLIVQICTSVSTHLNAAELGSEVQNIASISYRVGTETSSTITPPATFIVEAERTPSTVDFFRYVPNAPDGVSYQINGSDLVVDPALPSTAFTPIGPAIIAGRTEIDLSGPITLAPADDYFHGEVVFVRVMDAGQNGDPLRIETVLITIETPSGDSVSLRLHETGVNTGVFFAYIPSTDAVTAPNDEQLTILNGQQLTATYIDPFDLTEVSTDVAGVDPFGRLFDSVTGELLDGVSVTILDTATGQPADVFGIDGVSQYPSTVVTGSLVTDASGVTYQLNAGQFVFPIMLPGEYVLSITPPGAYTVPSIFTADQFTNLPNSPFTIADASYLRPFTLDGTGDVTFDVPIDPQSEITILKETSAETAAIGDFVQYTLTVENTGDNATPIFIRDFLPRGFRYKAGSFQQDGLELANPDIAISGTNLLFDGGILQPNDVATFSYVTEIGPATRLGEVVNQALVESRFGTPLSNTAESAITVRDDFLRNSLTIVGRVASNACAREGDEPPYLFEDAPMQGVRLYMETGTYTTTDEDGLFHFEDIDPGVHVVQVDTASLPKGYEPELCEDNTRYAGSAISKFIDAQGGMVWRANFYLRKTADAEERSQAATQPEKLAADSVDYLNYDKAWLAKQDGNAAWVYPAEGTTPSSRSIHIGVKHHPTERAVLILNDEKVPALNFAGRDVNLLRTAGITRWRSVDMVEGENRFTAIILDAEQKEVGRVERTIQFVNQPANAELLLEKSILVADGVAPPTLAIRITDNAGRPLRAGQFIEFYVDPPYRANDVRRLEDIVPISDGLATEGRVEVGSDGIANVKLAPTLDTGKVRVVVRLDEAREVELFAYLTPAMREWIVVGLAEGSLGATQINEGGPTSNTARELMRDGRAAVFAKGSVGEWLLTIAGDTDKRRGAEDDDLFDVIDPDDRYAIVGDRSEQQFEAQSRYPVYLKAEKGAFQTVFGDYRTGLNEVRLGKYDRRFSGLQSVYEGERFRFSGFAAETNQGFLRDEFAADGTSGPFSLSTAPLVRNSETITVETRNRFRANEIIRTTELTRYLDYDIDFNTGEVIFRLPIAATSKDFHINVIVAEYETSAPVDRNLVAGGRGAVRFANGKVELGITAVHEEGRPGALDAQSDLGAVDLRVDVSDTTRLRLEYGHSRREEETLPRNDASAVLAEVEHNSENLQGRAYYERTEGGFGLGQQSTAAVGITRYGTEARLRVGEFNDERTGRRGERFIEAAAYREENIETGANRTIGEVGISQQSDRMELAVGLRQIIENTADDVRRRSLQLTSRVRRNFEKIGLTLRGSRDQALTSSDESIVFPTRTRVGFDQRIVQDVVLSVDHEILDGDQASSSNTVVGLTAAPWTGARVTLSGDRLTQDTGERLGATLGVDQQVRLSEKWSSSFGVTRREQLGNDAVVDPVDDITPDGVLSPTENNEDFTSVFAGLAFRSRLTNGSARMEMRKSEAGNRYVGVVGVAREISDELSLAGAARYEDYQNNDLPDEHRFDARFGLAWRPRNMDGTIIFDRFDIIKNDVTGDVDSWKMVNNFALNTLITKDLQLALHHGLKYSQFEIGDDSFNGFTQLVGSELRYDITDNIDLGMRGSVLYSHNANSFEYSFGPSVGINPLDNVWLSAGWNITGFKDPDFEAAEFSRRGPYIQLRIKFDQNTARGLLQQIQSN